jgi:ABC-type Fe2+-enterobactin transport system substrate-binding protein
MFWEITALHSENQIIHIKQWWAKAAFLHVTARGVYTVTTTSYRLNFYDANNMADRM